jgi:hypothetical protein
MPNRYKFNNCNSKLCVDPSGRSVKGVVLRPLNFWDCGLGGGGDGCLSVLSVVCCQVGVYTNSRGDLPTVVRLAV